MHNSLKKNDRCAVLAFVFRTWRASGVRWVKPLKAISMLST